MKKEKEILNRIDELEEFIVQDGEILNSIEEFEVYTIIGTLKWILES